MEGDPEIFRYELTVKNPETGLENTIIVHATSPEQALIISEKTKDAVLHIEQKYVIETKSDHS